MDGWMEGRKWVGMWPAPGWEGPELFTFLEEADAGEKTPLSFSGAHSAPHRVANPAAAVPGCPALYYFIPIPEPLRVVQPRCSPGWHSSGESLRSCLPTFSLRGAGGKSSLGGRAGRGPRRSAPPRTVLRAALHKGAGAAGAGARLHRLRSALNGSEGCGTERPRGSCG